MNRTLVILKPDAVERSLMGEILGRFERKGLQVAAAKLQVIEAKLAGAHYAEHAERPFYTGLIDFITRSPSL